MTHMSTQYILDDDAWHAVKEILDGASSGWVADVRVDGVRGVAILEDQVSQILRREEEDLRGGAIPDADQRDV